MVSPMIALIAIALAGQAAEPPTSPPPPAPQAPLTQPWNPAAPYVIHGQDEPGYRAWYLADPGRATAVKGFNDYLATADVAGILPTWQLLRTASAWQDCGGQPFEVPPTSEWPHIIQTLRYIRDYVIPAIGPVEAVSAYRNPELNKCAGGAPESAHKLDSAIDMVPLRPTTREAMMKALCVSHSEHGAPYNAGLGFYAFLRFHIDSTKFRRWNMDPAVAALCPPLLQPEDAASSGQPLPPQPAPTVVPTAPPATPAVSAPAVQTPQHP